MINFEKKVMAKITLKGSPVNTSGDIPSAGSLAPDFKLVKSDLTTLSLSELKGTKIVLSISPSLDTSICAISVRKFNQMVTEKANTMILAITKDLPFASNRFCSLEGITNVVPLSAFGKSYGVEIVDGSFAGLYARCLVVVDENGIVIHSQLVPEIAQEPDYEAALAVL
jgi:thiol peroxidase